jgi:hypothetical protein
MDNIAQAVILFLLILVLYWFIRNYYIDSLNMSGEILSELKKCKGAEEENNEWSFPARLEHMTTTNSLLMDKIRGEELKPYGSYGDVDVYFTSKFDWHKNPNKQWGIKIPNSYLYWLESEDNNSI